MQLIEFNGCYTPEPYSGCWLWLRAINSSGYGNINRKNEREKAHRIAWKLFRGEIPAGMCVLHTCDVRACVNPAHLFIGTNADNIRDRDAKGRTGHATGEINGRAKLTAAQVAEIRQSTKSNVALGKQYGVRDTAISRIRRGKAWKTYESEAK